MNKVIILGRLGKDVELSYTNSGTPVAKMSVATSETWTDKSGERQEKTEWHRVVVWNKLAELCSQFLKKGQQCFVEGKLETKSWENDSGVKQYSTEVIASSVQFLGGSSNE